MTNLQRLREFLQINDYTGVILGRQDNYLWLTEGGRNEVLTATEMGVAYLVVTADELLLVADVSDARRMSEEQNRLGAKLVEVPWEVGVVPFLTEYCEGRRMMSDCGVLDTPSIEAQLVELRLDLREEDIEHYREIGKQMAEIVEEVIVNSRPGETEKSVATRLEKMCLSAGVAPDCVLVGSDERINKYRHPVPTDKAIEKTLMIVLGGEKYGLYVSLTRMVCFGEVSTQLAEKMKGVQYIFAGMQGLLEAGKKYQDYFSEVINLYEEVGYAGEWRLHHQGGPTGYACREIVVSETTPGTMEAGYVFAWNPTITGTKCEDTTYLNENGVENFTDSGKWPRTTVKTPYGTFGAADIKVIN
ncbi:Xaa-Pro dipeptidase [Lachnospiraceae bacterium PM6-15]|uniref:M24 family metallopeptidase n=1 Tax=Ohessyouella blattaphilus TaxID=2949333 RepID=UPI003E321862